MKCEPRDQCLFYHLRRLRQLIRHVSQVDVSHYPKPVGLLQLPPCRTAVVDRSPTAASSKRRCPDRFGAFSTSFRHWESCTGSPSSTAFASSCTSLIFIAVHPMSVTSYHLSATMASDDGCAHRTVLTVTFHAPFGERAFCVSGPVSLEVITWNNPYHHWSQTF